MRLKFDLSGLDILIRKMGAKQTDWRLSGTEIPERQSFFAELEKGKEITLDDISQKGNLLEHQGEQVLLYIKDTRSSRETLLRSPEDSRRFHISECGTLRSMRRNNRFSRYHVASRLDGKFNCTWVNEEENTSGEVDAELKVCMRCLKEINWEDYSHVSGETQNTIWNSFDIAEFLRSYQTVFHSKPTRGESYPVTPTYIRDWPKISKNFRASRMWRCDRCKVDLTEHRKLLHTHHINGDLGDNSIANLEALCVLCHADEPQHGRLSYSRAEKLLIENLRIHEAKRN